MKKAKGFTFIEIMLVAAMLSVIGLVLGAVLTNGVAIWDRVNEVTPDEDIALFFDDLTLDLKNAVHFQGIDFSGKDVSFTVPHAPGSVTYFFDEDTLTLNKEERTYSQICENKNEKSESMVSNVISAKFTYYVYDEGVKMYVWMEVWNKTFPLAVKSEIKLKRKDGPYNYVETIDLPLAKTEPKENLLAT